MVREELAVQLLKVEACKVLKTSYERGWISTRDGNISIREDGQNFQISPSGTRKHSLRPEEFVLIGTSGLAGQAQPSGELELHRRVQALLPVGWTTVLHLHPTYAVAALYAGYRLADLAADFPEVSRYTRVGADVPALPATSASLAQATDEVFQSGDKLPHIVGLDRHGIVAIGRDPWDAFEHVESLEHICKIVLSAAAAPSPRAPTGAAGTAGADLVAA